MKPAFIVAGVLASLAGMIVLPAVTATDSEPNLPAEIAVTFSGSYEEIVIRNQQRARKEEHPPTWARLARFRTGSVTNSPLLESMAASRTLPRLGKFNVTAISLFSWDPSDPLPGAMAGKRSDWLMFLMPFRSGILRKGICGMGQ